MSDPRDTKYSTHQSGAVSPMEAEKRRTNQGMEARTQEELEAHLRAKQEMEDLIQEEISGTSKTNLLPVNPVIEKLHDVDGPNPVRDWKGWKYSTDHIQEISDAPASEVSSYGGITSEEIFGLHQELTIRALELMRQKNADYSGGKGDPLANFRGSEMFDIHPINGLMLRVTDKLMRMNSFVDKGELQVKDEPVDDIALDLINYAVLMMALVLEQRQREKKTRG